MAGPCSTTPTAASTPRAGPGAALLVPLPAAVTAPAADPGVLWQIAGFFGQAGAFVFGSGLAIVPFLYGGVVGTYGWLTDRQFLDAVSMAITCWRRCSGLLIVVGVGMFAVKRVRRQRAR